MAVGTFLPQWRALGQPLRPWGPSSKAPDPADLYEPVPNE